jgi:hypothetical protein
MRRPRPPRGCRAIEKTKTFYTYKIWCRNFFENVEFLYREDGGIRFLHSSDIYLPVYTVSHPKIVILTFNTLRTSRINLKAYHILIHPLPQVCSNVGSSASGEGFAIVALQSRACNQTFRLIAVLCFLSKRRWILKSLTLQIINQYDHWSAFNLTAIPVLIS